MLWEDVSFVLASKLSRKILETLNYSEKPLAPMQIAKQSDIARSNVSTKLRPLIDKNLVRCINPKAKKWRFYVITNKGKEVLQKIEDMK